VHQKFATAVNDNGSKFSAGVNYTCIKEDNVKFATGTAGVVDIPVSNNGNKIRLLKP
jgi:hypothetical protein